MVPLYTSVSALGRLLSICEYAKTQDLRYNLKINELLIFKVTLTSVNLRGTVLCRVSQVKDLGHWVMECLFNDVQIDKKRRALAVKNMLTRRCNRDVMLTLFKSFCRPFYKSSCWIKCTQKTYHALLHAALECCCECRVACTAQGAFAKARSDVFNAIPWKRVAFLMCGVQGRRVNTESIPYLTYTRYPLYMSNMVKLY